ncbi:PIG-L family deacetylase [Candidatus Daviesbacteria bacterium]|nr:PIG-L family deacetylase [Candidatus Daviesbacteria bacterium]
MKNSMKGKTVLVVVAHPDDAEFGAAGTVAKWVGEGATAYYVICTSGNRGSRHHQIDQEKLVEARKKEQLSAAKILGVKEVFFLDHEDGNLVADINFKEEIVKLIRKLKPDAVFTHDPTWVYRVNEDGTAFINHNDHRETGLATVDAVYPLARDLASFPHHQDEGLAPHKVPELYLFHIDQPNFYVDITEVLGTKLRALKVHKSQFDDPKSIGKFLKRMSAEIGKKAGFKYAEGFIKLTLR